MLMLEDSDMVLLNNAEQYNAWKGQLYINEQLVCNISLQATSACSIPAQLPQKLELKEVIRASELRTKLPEDVFQKTDLTGQEVSCGNIYYSLYAVITSDIVGPELDKLLKYLKDQDLALIKVLNDHGFLVLVSSAVFQSSTGISDGNSAQLYALFLFPQQRFLDKREREEWKGNFTRKDFPLAISNLLPGFQYAIIESSKFQKDKAIYPGPLVEQFFNKYAVLQKKRDSSSERKTERSEPLSVCYSYGDDLPKKCSELAFSCLQLYVSSPVNFSVSLIKMSNLLAEHSAPPSNSDQCDKTIEKVKKQSSPSKLSTTAGLKAGSDRPQGRHAVREDKEQHSKRNTKKKIVKRGEKKSKRKSSRRSALSTAETGENQASNKRRRLFSDSKKQIVSSSEATIKLASAPYSQRRKRGAEVLTAAFIQDERMQTEKTVSSKTNEENKNLTQNPKAIKRKPRKILAPEDHHLVPERSSKRKASDPGNKNLSVGVATKSEGLKRTSEKNGEKKEKIIKKNQEKIKDITVAQINPLSKTSENLRHDKNSPPLSAQISENSMMEKRISMYESHALNLLADLALNSFGSTNIPYLKSGSVACASEPLVEEAESTGNTVSTVVDHSQDCSFPAQSASAFAEPEHIVESESDKPKNGLNVSPRNAVSQKRTDVSEKQMSQKAHIAAAKAKARYNATSKISLEHSYSQLPIEDISGKFAKETNEQPIQVVPDTTTPVDIVPETSTNGLPGDTVLSSSETLCTAQKQRKVSKSQDNFVITFHREPKYDFDLDSKFTSDPLEKTINRALHGPWNLHLKEKLEDVKIILHMWIALFYSKCNKQINCSSRKVVEHSNPAKYVSINTVLDPFEFYELTESDGAPSAENTNAILSMGKMSGLPRQVNPHESALSCKSGKSRSKNLQDLTIPTKAKSKEIEHKYSRDFSSKSEAHKSTDSQEDCAVGSSDADETEGNLKASVSSAGYTRLTYSSDIINPHKSVIPSTIRDSRETSSELEFADKKAEYPCAESTTVYNLNMDITNENSASVGHYENYRNPKDLEKNERSLHTKSPLYARMPPGVDKHQTARSKHLLKACILPQEFYDSSAISDESDSPPDDAIQNSEDSDNQMAITSRFSVLGINSPSGHIDATTEFCMDKHSDMADPLIAKEALKCDRNSSGIWHVDGGSLPTADTSVHSVQSEEIQHNDRCTDHSASNLGAQKTDLCPDLSKNIDSNLSVDYNSNCTKEGKIDSTWDSAVVEERQKEAVENIPRESGNLVESEHIHSENVLNEITASDIMSRLELSDSSDEGSNMEDTIKSFITDHMKSGDQESIDKSLKESSKKTEGQGEHSIRENESSTSVDNSMPATFRANIALPNNHGDQETDVLETGHMSEASMVAEVEMEVPEKSFVTLNIAQSCLIVDDADLSNLATTNVDESQHEASKNEVPCTEENPAPDHAVPSAEQSHKGTCSEDGPLSAGVSKYEMNRVPSTSSLGDPDIESSEKSTVMVSAHCEKHEVLAESQNHLLISQATCEGKNITNTMCSVECVSEEDDLSDSAVTAMQVNTLLTKAKTQDCQTIIKSSVCTGSSKDTLEDLSDEDALESNITSSFSDLLMGKFNEIDCEQQSLEKQQTDLTDDVVYISQTLKPTRSSVKDSTHNSRNSASNKKEILSKLKRICLGSTTSHQVASSSENVLSQDKNNIKSSLTEDQYEVIDLAENELPCVAEKCAIEDPSHVESAIGTVNTGVPNFLKGVMSAIATVNTDEPDPPEEVMFTMAAVNTGEPDAPEGVMLDIATVNTIESDSPEEVMPAIASVNKGEPDSPEGLMSAIAFVNNGEPDSPEGVMSAIAIVNTGEPDFPEGVTSAIATVNTSEPDSPEGVMLVTTSVNKGEPDSPEGVKLAIATVNTVEPDSPEEVMPSIATVNTSEPDSPKGVMPFIATANTGEPDSPEVMSTQDDCLMLPSLEDVSESIEQDPSAELPDICFIVNTGSISKEQYDRWSETSDDDIEYIRSYKEPLPDDRHFQKEIHQSSEIFLDETNCSEEQTSTSRIEKSCRKQPGSSSSLFEKDEYFSRHLQDLDYNSITKRGNVTVTKNIKDADRALQTINKESPSRSDLNHLFSDRRMVSDNLTQNTLDMENVRFMCKLKEVLRKSSTDKHIYGPPFQTVFESRRIPTCSRSTTKSRSPLLITVPCPYRRKDFRKHDSRHSSSYNSSSYYEDELWDRPVTHSRTIRKVRTPGYSPFHFSQLRYENTLDKSNTDISVILNECVQSNHLKLSSIGLGSTAVDRPSANQLPKEGGWQTRRKHVPVSSKSHSVKNVISDLCMSLHSRLQTVARVSEQKMYFYIYETDDGDFISSAKSLLVKDGHIPTDPQEFLSSEHCKSPELLVIIKNEDVFSCINKIPYLKQLKLMPNVAFAGVDTPEDMAESTYEELFQAGGFVASDKTVLENITLGKLKEILAVLEKMNRNSPWKWLIHYRENRKLKENKRSETLSVTKMSLLKSYQHSNIIEILPYHQCDSRSKEPLDDLSCLLNLQYQHIHSRLAVYLTGTTSMVTEEYEQNGIIVYDVDTFLRKIQKVDLQFQAPYWS
ncbi:protein TASOR 2 isoform X2 [Dendropsophus ebraccatus]|uniref:protein TASOR 2 isoform X2 n=1 Tax=Dendropsophus ebraccatus TaxID=150705 RepID=UPI0038314F91